MKIIRSFPDPIPPNRDYVMDGKERFYNTNFDYRGIQEIGDDIVLLEWDVAMDNRNLDIFIERALKSPDWPIAVPYYKSEDGIKHWMHFRLIGTQNGGDLYRPVYEGEPDCDQFGTGMCWLPYSLLKDCPDNDAGSQILNEGVLCRYLRSLPQWRPIPLMWDIQVTHLH